MTKTDKPDYVAALEAVYGPPSDSGFGSAVFMQQLKAGDDLEQIAQHYYQAFVGDLWQKWGEENWLGTWKQVYARPAGAKAAIVQELKGIKDPSASMSAPMILDVVQDAQAGQQALAATYDAPEVTDLQVYNIGDGGAMSGILLAGRRANGDATFLVFLLD